MACTPRLLVCRLASVHGRLLWPQPVALSRRLSAGPQLSRSLQESYRLLQLPDHCTPAQVREAYLRLAKLHHPDSGAPTADPALFARVEEAYRAILAHQSKKRAPGGVTEDDDDDSSRGAALPHRHYLSYEGLGSGSPSQRERQYRQIRVDRASDRVLSYRQKEHEEAAAGEGALVERDMRQRSRKIKITQAVERLVEDLIQESMARGDFRNLSGAGKPLNKFQHNPYADPMTHNLNRILIDNGYQPPWVVTHRDIQEAAARVRSRLLEGRARLGDRGPDRGTPQEEAAWRELCASVAEDVARLNKLVDNYNLIVPMLSMQMVHFSLAREVERAERAAQQHVAERLRERGKDREKRIEERKRANAQNKPQTAKRGLVTWMQSFLR